MELFKYITAPGVQPTILTEGRMINGATSVMWTERYRDPGEFQIVAPLSSGLREFLPLGTIISHVDTMEIMIVENHEITEEAAADPTLTITGRSFETYLDNRIVGMNQVRTSSTLQEYVLVPNYIWEQAIVLINAHGISAPQANDIIDNIWASSGMPVGSTGVYESRSIKRVGVHTALLELLAIEDLGVKTIRRNTFGVGVPTHSANYTFILIHKGTDRSSSVIFSWKSGDLEQADYLWSDKRDKNSAVVVGRYVNVAVDTVGVDKFARRSMVVDGSDIDGVYNAPPTGQALTDVITAMQVRGRAAIANQNLVTITRADLAQVSKYQYRKDFEVGDFITVDANFGQIAKMRIIEYVEIMDENGETGHPTLSLPGV